MHDNWVPLNPQPLKLINELASLVPPLWTESRDGQPDTF